MVFAGGEEGVIFKNGMEPLALAPWRYIAGRVPARDAAVLDYGRILVVGSDGSWARYSYSETIGGLLPGVTSFNAVAPGPGLTVMAVGDAGVIAWGRDGLQSFYSPFDERNRNDVRYVGEDLWFIVGDDGWVQQRYTDGSVSISHNGASDHNLNAIWSRAQDDVYIAGDNGTVLVGDATTNEWVDMACPLEGDLLALDGTDGEYLFVVGRHGAMARHDGDEWEILDPPHDGDLLKVMVISWRRVYVLTDDNRLLEYVIVNP